MIYQNKLKQLEIDFKKFYLGIFVIKTKPFMEMQADLKCMVFLPD